MLRVIMMITSIMSLDLCGIAIQILLDAKKPIAKIQLSPSNGKSFVFSVSPIVVQPFGQCRGSSIRSVSALMSDHLSVASLCL